MTTGDRAQFTSNFIPLVLMAGLLMGGIVLVHSVQWLVDAYGAALVDASRRLSTMSTTEADTTVYHISPSDLAALMFPLALSLVTLELVGLYRDHSSYSITTFGTIAYTRTRDLPQARVDLTPCTSCGWTVSEHGTIKEYGRAIVVIGVPFRVVDGRNRYCETCSEQTLRA